MYQDFFGFKERPFQLLPNPAYLFLGRSHEEALAHLLYAVSHGEGFVEISGEVGTGKTTLCRALLESLGEEVEAAYIFHPKLDPLELLQAVGAEFGIASRADTTRGMIEILHRFLIEKKEERKKVLLIIDEAQNLTRDVLEQVRLLSNLETTTSKLIQIILVGQPELIALLDSHEMRQLRQRLSLRCRLAPLTRDETREYIRYRVDQASREARSNLFTRSAVARIYRYSGGIPRLINIACDRALLSAYGSDSLEVTGRIAGRAVRELTETGPSARGRVSREQKRIAVLLVLALILLLDGLLPSGDRSRAPRPPAPPAADRPPAPSTPAAARPGPAPAPEAARQAEAPQRAEPPLRVEPRSAERRSPEEFMKFLESADRNETRRRALFLAMVPWNPGGTARPKYDFLDDDLTFFRLNAQTEGLSVTPVYGGVSMLNNLDLPTIMVVAGPGAPEPRYLTLTRISEQAFRLGGVGESGYVELNAADIYDYWTGKAYVVWKNFLGLDGVIPLNSSPESVVSLKILLSEMGFPGLDASADYDDATREAVFDIQKRHGIFVDGLVGPLTAIAIYNVARGFDIPHIKEGSP